MTIYTPAYRIYIICCTGIRPEEGENAFSLTEAGERLNSLCGGDISSRFRWVYVVIVVYHVTIVAVGNGLLRKF